MESDMKFSHFQCALPAANCTQWQLTTRQVRRPAILDEFERVGKNSFLIAPIEASAQVEMKSCRGLPGQRWGQSHFKRGGFQAEANFGISVGTDQAVPFQSCSRS
jgi:hypothetical protein